MKRHEVVWHVKSYSLVPDYGRGLAVIGAFDYSRKNFHACDNICNLVVFYQLAALIYCMVLSSEPLFVHELERQYDVSLWIDAKHITDDKTPLYLVLRHIKYITCSRFCLNCQQSASVVVNCHNIWKTRTAAAQPLGTPLPII